MKKLEDIPLTEEQRQLVSDNHQLIFGAAHKYGINLDEHYDTLAIALCKAAQSFNPNAGFTFATYAYKAMEREYIKYFRQQGRQKIIPDGLIQSANEPVTRDPDSPDSLYFIPEHRSSMKPGIERLTVIDFASTLNETEQKVFWLLYFGSSDAEIAKKMNFTRATAWHTKIRLRRQWHLYNRNYQEARRCY